MQASEEIGAPPDLGQLQIVELLIGLCMWMPPTNIQAATLPLSGEDEDQSAKRAVQLLKNEFLAAKQKAQEDAVISGFGNNGGEEFLSFLQTGESLVVNDDKDWRKWYDNTTGRIMKIQNDDGSWNGHHCITSPVFCTATSLLILSIENDIDRLKKIGEQG